ncbi:MAG: protein-L-isoaspartate(D-aspartate) O-methyltransferase [Gemmatimonadales bacterium]|nr:protein-L-isoaspartate(D-aspartate) O-methyltransferase [Gemmatimonadales bacterium]
MVARGVGPAGPADGYAGYRIQLVEALRQRGIEDLAVLHAVSEVPRHLFVPESVRHRAYEDSALPIGADQTISQPWVHARSIELLQLRPDDKVLEVGTGSGYQTALLARLAGNVFSIERVAALAEGARQALAGLGLRNVSFLVGDGTLGWRSWAPFDKIVIGAASPDVPAPLLEQLAPGGRLVLPIGDRGRQVLTLVERTPDGLRRTTAGDVRFVPLLGEHGF